MKDKFKQAYMQTARTFAELSHARRLKVGCIIVKDDRIISIGYNGMPTGWDNNCEDEILNVHDGSSTLKTKPEVLHAETNAIAKLARSNENGDGASLFVTHSPCIDCAKLIYQAGIKQLFFAEQYRDQSGIDFLVRSGVDVQELPK